MFEKQQNSKQFLLVPLLDVLSKILVSSWTLPEWELCTQQFPIGKFAGFVKIGELVHFASNHLHVAIFKTFLWRYPPTVIVGPAWCPYVPSSKIMFGWSWANLPQMLNSWANLPNAAIWRLHEQLQIKNCVNIGEPANLPLRNCSYKRTFTMHLKRMNSTETKFIGILIWPVHKTKRSSKAQSTLVFLKINPTFVLSTVQASKSSDYMLAIKSFAFKGRFHVPQENLLIWIPPTIFSWRFLWSNCGYLWTNNPYKKDWARPMAFCCPWIAN